LLSELTNLQSMKSPILFKFLYGLALMVLLLQSACNIEEIVYDENPFLIRKNPLNFKELQQSNQSINHTDSLLIIAKASGDNLSFEWNSSGGLLIAKDSSAVFIPDTTGVFTITCKATDKYDNTDTRETQVMVVMELVFDGIGAADTLLPPGLATQLTAFASGEQLEFTWSTSGGEITGSGSQVEFKANSTGTFVVNCIAKDKYEEEVSQELMIEVTDNLIFKRLDATKTTIEPYEVTVITARAFGQGLSYQWNAEPMGVLLGYYETVYFSNCCGNIHSISCKITDNKGNTGTRYITITIIE
jgi:hypothetical protein